MTVTAANPYPQVIKAINADNTSAPAGNGDFFGRDGFSFKDILDIVNPLQQIPIVSTIYREISGDTISAGARLIGGTLFGGPIGFLSAMANSAFEGATGKDIGGSMLAMLDGTSKNPHQPHATQLASNSAALDAPLSAKQKMAYNAYVQASALA